MERETATKQADTGKVCDSSSSKLMPLALFHASICSPEDSSICLPSTGSAEQPSPDSGAASGGDTPASVLAGSQPGLRFAFSEQEAPDGPATRVEAEHRCQAVSSGRLPVFETRVQIWATA